MKALGLIASLSLGLASFTGSLAASGVAAVVDANFNNVTVARVAAYPPSAGSRFRELEPAFSGWSGGGQMQLTIAPGYGADGTGGVHFEVLKDGKFHQASFKKLDFPMLGPGRMLRDPLRALQFSVDAKIPAGKEVQVYLAVEVPKEIMAESPWSKRLVLGTLRGTDTYKRYTFGGRELPEDMVNIFISFLRDLHLNGMQVTTCTLVVHLEGNMWIAGEGFLFDNVRLALPGS
jgi:hypothetical protein